MHISNIGSIDLNLFVVFEAIVRQRSVSGAARELNLTQPAVSHALARLRDGLEDPLFVRRGREMVPTPRARGLVEPVRDALRGLSTCLEAEANFDPATAKRSVVLGLRDGMEACVLPVAMAHLDVEAPGIELQSLTVARRDMQQELASGRLDAAVDVQLPVTAEVVQEPLLTDPLVMLMRSGHPLARKRVTLKRYLDARHVLVSSRRRGPGLEDYGLAQADQHRTIALRCQHYQSALEVVAGTDLLLTLPSVLASRLATSERFASRKLPAPLPPITLYLYWHRDLQEDPAHRWLRELLLRGM